MKHWTRPLGIALFAPILSAALVGGIALENSTHLKPTDVEPYHHRAREAVLGRELRNGQHEGGVPYTIGSWYGKDEEIPVAAQQLLKPNAILSRSYRDTTSGAIEAGRFAS